MDDVITARLGLRTSAIGLGCGGLGGRLGRRASLRVLEEAGERGIRHLDVARSYGYGYAEDVVGTYLKGRRDDVFLVTKAGVLPARPTMLKRLAVAPARQVVSRFPSLRRHASRRAGRGISAVASVGDLEASFSRSLAALGVDDVDLLLLHEMEVESMTAEVLAWLDDDVVTAGRARAWGVATSATHTAAILAKHDPAVINVPSSASEPSTEVLDSSGPDLRCTHSSLGSDLRSVQAHLQAPTTRRRWEDALGQDLSPAVVPSVLLRAARARNPGGVVLAGTQTVEHVAAIAAAGDGPVDPALAASVAALVADAASAEAASPRGP